MAEIDYDEVFKRIGNIYNSCNDSERAIFYQILQEMADKGYSQTLEQIWLRDFTEVPVSIDEFLCNSHYLGETNNEGEMVYPFWKDTLRNIFTESNNYFEVIFSGATRIGKTSTAIAGMSYMLYRLMIYRDPHTYFKKKQVSKFTIGFANITKELAAGVGFREFNDTLVMSPWFMEHGKRSQSEKNFYYMPEGNKIEIIAASDSSHLLGKQLWACLTGDTKIVTCESIKSIEELSGSQIGLPQLNVETGQIEICSAYVVKTKEVQTICRVTFEDGFTICGTKDHKILTCDNKYKNLWDLYEGDEVVSIAENGISDISKVYLVELLEYDSIPVYDVINAGNNHNFLIWDEKNEKSIVSHNCLMDEVNFTKAGVKDVNKAKVAMKSMYDTANARITGTFKIAGQVYGKMFTCSSKNTDSDYLSHHIETQLNAGNTSMYLVDEPQWEVLPSSMFSRETFYITVGDRYKRGFVVPQENSDELHLKEYEQEGYKLLEVPKDFLSNFNSDYDIALRDIAGISVVGSMGFITQESVTVNVTEERKNPFYFDIIVCGVSDNETIERNFHLNEVPSNMKSLPLYIHIDFAEVSDHIGICGVVQDGTKIIVDTLTGRKNVMPFYKQVFQIAVEAPRGDRMSFQKVINFIIWLRRSGFNVCKVTTDQYQSSYAREELKRQGFQTDKVSVDSSMDPYTGLRNLLQEQRIELVKHQLQEDELVNLQRINGRIDHPPQSSESSEGDNYSRSGPPGNGYGKGIGKDCSDALAGAVWSLLQEQQLPTMDTKTMSKTVAMLNNSRSIQPRPSVMNFNNYKRRF